MFSIAIRGFGSSIARGFSILYPSEEVFQISRGQAPPFDIRRYLICQGILYGKKRIDMSAEEIFDTYQVNCHQMVDMCEKILENNDRARICVMGSESGFSGSYDECYADAKSILHHYVETTVIKPEQQLVCVSPTIIEDSGMTIRRTDVDNLNNKRRGHPKGRFLSSREVAKMIHFLLYEDEGYTTGTIIRMHGGMKKNDRHRL